MRQVRVTKKPKRVVVMYKAIETYILKYTCPSCQTTFVGGGPDKNVLRFRCKCGQELIVCDK